MQTNQQRITASERVWCSRPASWMTEYWPNLIGTDLRACSSLKCMEAGSCTSYTKSLELDFFILKSSLLSLLGSAGQGTTPPAAAFLDSLAAHRRAVGLPATAINLVCLVRGGLATVSGARGEAMWSALGVKSVSPESRNAGVRQVDAPRCRADSDSSC